MIVSICQGELRPYSARYRSRFCNVDDQPPANAGGTDQALPTVGLLPRSPPPFVKLPDKNCLAGFRLIC